MESKFIPPIGSNILTKKEYTNSFEQNDTKNHQVPTLIAMNLHPKDNWEYKIV